MFWHEMHLAADRLDILASDAPWELWQADGQGGSGWDAVLGTEDGTDPRRRALSRYVFTLGPEMARSTADLLRALALHEENPAVPPPSAEAVAFARRTAHQVSMAWDELRKGETR